MTSPRTKPKEEPEVKKSPAAALKARCPVDELPFLRPFLLFPVCWDKVWLPRR